MADSGPVTCAGCGLLCDDVTVESSSDGVRLRPECPLGSRWFTERMRDRGPTGAAATIDGEPVELESALARATELLRGARRPLVRGFDHATVEDARAAVALADHLGALVSTENVTGEWSGAPAVPLRGAFTATLGEIRDRSRLVVIWREDPERTHPRLLERLRLGDGERTLVLVDDAETATAGRADVRLAWPRERDLDALTALHAMIGRRPRLAGGLAGIESTLSELRDRVRAVPHLAIVYGPGLTGGAGGQRRALALHELVRALCQERHAVSLELPRAPGTRSAGDVLAWQSGYGGSVDFSDGHPQLSVATQPPDDADVTLCVEADPAGLLAAGSGVEVWIRTAAAGVQASGTMHRLDGVPLTLQSPHADAGPTAAALLERLLGELRR